MRANSQFDELYRVPVRRLAATLTLADGARREGTLFLGNDETGASPLLARRAFFPVDEGGTVRLYAAAAVACISVAEEIQPADPCERALLVRAQLKSDVAIEGELRFIPSEGKARLADALAETSSVIVLVEPRHVHYVQKTHVLCVEERK